MALTTLFPSTKVLRKNLELILDRIITKILTHRVDLLNIEKTQMQIVHISIIAENTVQSEWFNKFLSSLLISMAVKEKLSLILIWRCLYVNSLIV